MSRGKCPVTSLASALDGRHGEYVSLWVCFGHSLAPRRVLGSYALPGVRAIKKQTTVPKRSKKLVCMAYSLVWLSISTFIYYSAADRGAEYCDERVCLSVSLSVSVCVCVRLSAIISSELHVLSSPNSVHVICGSSSGLLWRRNDT